MLGKLFRKILIATDGSEYTKKAVDHGIELAKNNGAKIYAIYVIDTSAMPQSHCLLRWNTHTRF